MPKSLLQIGSRAIIEHSLEVLASRGIERATLVVGYQKNVLIDRLGAHYGPIDIHYIESPDYANTERGWSWYLTRTAWEIERRSVLFMDADILYEPTVLDLVIEDDAPDVIAVDSAFDGGARMEEIVTGAGGGVSHLLRGLTGAYPDYVGGFIGINRLSGEFMHALYDYMENFFQTYGRTHAYERVIDRFLSDTGATLGYVDSTPRAWINVNHESDLAQAQRVAQLMSADSLPVSAL